jgi:hypothetical protein
MGEKKIYFMCPRRKEAGPWRQVPDDFWRDNRWQKEEGWEIDFIPRSCSFCGSIHPEDAIILLNMGWEVELTTKRYKRYLHPSGFKKRMEEVLTAIKEGKEVDEDKPEGYWEPSPVVKLYTMHFSKEQMERFNRINSSN